MRKLVRNQGVLTLPINVNDPEYVSAEKAYNEANTLEGKLTALKKMISHAPKHKGGENLRQQLTTRRKKFEAQITKAKKSGKSTQIGIKKDGLQTAIIGFTNTGKSTLLAALTNAHPKISENRFSTTQPQIGMTIHETIPIQLIEIPAIESENFDKGLANGADTILALVTKFEQISKILLKLKKSPGKKIIVFNKIDILSENEKRKLTATLQSKKYNFILISAVMKKNLNELKSKITKTLDKLRIYTKEPNKPKSNKPIIMKKKSTVKHVAEKILKGFSKKVKQTKIWGPSSKFSGQIVGLNHKLKDLDVIEFKTK